MPIEAIVIPTWAADRYSSSRSIWREDERRRSGRPPCASASIRAAPGADQRELGRDEQPVERDEHEQEDQEQGRHRAPRSAATSRKVVVHRRRPEDTARSGMDRAAPSVRADCGPEAAGRRRTRDAARPVASARYGDAMDQRPVPYVDALREHAERDPARLYVPGHKGGPGADPALVDAAGPRALEMDIPALIPGIDVGPEPTPFGLAQQLAADAWGAKRSWFLLNGASQGNHAACLALRHSGRRRRRPEERPLERDRRRRPGGARAHVRRPRARPRPRGRALRDRRRAGGCARRDARRGRGRSASRRLTSEPAPTSPRWPRSHTRTACRW